MDSRIRKTTQSLQRNNMVGYYVEDETELTALLEKLIPEGSSVGYGDSVTLEQTGVFNFLRTENYVFYGKHRPGLPPEERRSIYLQNFGTGTFITGTNAITQDEKLLNIDDNGSHVAPMLYGPEQAIVVVSRNEITETAEDTIQRARQITAPLDIIRLGKCTPCIKLGRYVDCKHEERICNNFVLIAGRRMAGRIKVILVNRDCGYR